ERSKKLADSSVVTMKAAIDEERIQTPIEAKQISQTITVQRDIWFHRFGNILRAVSPIERNVLLKIGQAKCNTRYKSERRSNDDKSAIVFGKHSFMVGPC